MFKKIFGAIVAAGAVAAGVKVVKDILDADAEEKNIINLDEQPVEEERTEEE